MSVRLPDVHPDEDVLDYVQRLSGGFDARLYQQVLGAANAFKEGDAAIGVAAADEDSRRNARTLLSRTRLDDVHAHPPFEDRLHIFNLEAWDSARWKRVAGWTLGQLKDFLLTAGESQVHEVLDGLPSDVIACVVKLMTDAELKAVGGRIFHPLPGSRVGAKGYLGARLQPNSPTDHPEDIRWQVFNGWSFAVGDVVLGTNPVSSDPASVAAVESALHDVLTTFGLEEVMPHCVLAHIDVQAQVEALRPGTTGIWFQSLGGNEAANRTFDVTLEKMVAHAAARTGRWGLYFETGQGADATNGHHHGTDMLIHESRKYGFARALKRRVAIAQAGAGRDAEPWVHVNDVAGFIGPEVFRTREQLVRCCLEDIVMGKLHGLTLGLDVCSTLHMDVTLDDLGWCQEQLAEAGPAYMMALPTRNDPMLSYLTTSFQDHVRLRERRGLKVDDRMWAFFQRLGVIDADGRPTKHFGDPAHVYVHYRRHKGDTRTEGELRAEAEAKMAEVRARSVPLAVGHGEEPWTLEPSLEKDLRGLYEDAKVGLWSELSDAAVEALPGAVRLRTNSEDRRDYILHPPSGESLDAKSEATVRALRDRQGGRWDAQIVISDGLDPRSLMDAGHLAPFLARLRAELEATGWRVAPEVLVVKHGRVRAGYQVGQLLFGAEGDTRPRALVHVIGERPGSGHHAFSAYLTAPDADTWAKPGAVDHDRTRLIAGISDTSVRPEDAAVESARILAETRTSTASVVSGVG
ncbi:ethanolamine ammonia-lyase subunit EutB [Corallococcus carmarthensis]|uniref:Ethanolamine ammonia-lyase subunit EutB n=1 Tax=Corallococcus carmarthensis TaxID=2316728 RepID=A0A3A8KF66_9BACT|nr:ethanolamine ammonia-lyase subunit EutB [Corallococcus carmarthensis]RKH06176.1 ethanolamine ammonia-lyase subunit EutB [Corallococcus carmarthensis]